MSQILHVTVNNKIATYRQRDGAIICGNTDYSIQFTFDAEWEEHAVKTARFIYNNRVIDTVFEGDTVAVPILRNTALLAVGVFAGDLKTTTPATIPCVKSILCSEGPPPDPEPDVYAQIMELLNAGGGGEAVTDDRLDHILYPIDGQLIGGPNLVDDVRNLIVDGEVDETNRVKFKGAPRAVNAGELTGRWVQINRRRCYVGGSTADTLVLFTDETTTQTADMIAASGTTIYPADIEVTSVDGVQLQPVASRAYSLWDTSLHNVDGHLIGGPNLVDDVRTLKVDGEVDETNRVKFRGAPRAVTAGELTGRWVMIQGTRGYVGASTADTLVLFTDATKTQTLDMICPSGTIIYPADIEVTSIHGCEIRPIASRAYSLWNTSLYNVDGHLIGGPNLVDDVRTLKVDGEVDETNRVKFKGAPRAVTAGELTGRWVMIQGTRGYVGSSTANTLVLFTDSAKTQTLDMICPSGTTIYPADIEVTSIHGCEIRPVASKVTSMWDRSFYRVNSRLIGGPNLVDDVRTLKVDGEVDETNRVKFKGAPRAVTAGELTGRWVMIQGTRGYVGSSTANTLVLFTDSAKTQTLDMICPSGTTIYPADDLVAELPAVTTADNGKVLKVVNGVWRVVTP